MNARIRSNETSATQFSAGTAAAPSSAQKLRHGDVLLTRVLDAPRALVFKAWTDREQLARWWGPHGFTNPRCEIDVRPGGAILIHMRGPDGTVYPMTGVYQEIVEPDRLVFTSSALDEEGKPLFEVRTTVTFAEQNGKTTLTVDARVVSATPKAASHLAGANAGWSQTLDRLAEFVAQAMGGNGVREKEVSSASAADRDIIITRVFDAPRELVWDAWTDPKQVVQWWGPRGFTTTIHEMDVRPGGVWRQTMRGPDGTDYPNESVFIEVVKPERIVYSMSGGRKGDPAHQFEAAWTFEEQGEKTKLTLRMVFASAMLREHIAETYGVVEGGNQTLDRLGEFLAKIRS